MPEIMPKSSQKHLLLCTLRNTTEKSLAAVNPQVSEEQTKTALTLSPPEYNLQYLAQHSPSSSPKILMCLKGVLRWTLMLQMWKWMN